MFLTQVFYLVHNISRLLLLTDDVVANLSVVGFVCSTLATLSVLLLFVLLLFKLSQCLLQLSLETFPFSHLLFFILGFYLPKPEVDLSGVH